MKDPIPNRLAQTPHEVSDTFNNVVANALGFDAQTQTKRLRSVVDLAYSRGYQDGYRDGHIDAENGHDERVRAVVS